MEAEPLENPGLFVAIIIGKACTAALQVSNVPHTASKTMQHAW